MAVRSADRCGGRIPTRVELSIMLNATHRSVSPKDHGRHTDLAALLAQSGYASKYSELAALLARSDADFRALTFLEVFPGFQTASEIQQDLLRTVPHVRTNVIAVWTKGTTIPGCDPAHWRLDDDGSVISFMEHGNRHSLYGWEIDHILPAALGGSDEIGNLRPLHWITNAGRQPKR